MMNLVAFQCHGAIYKKAQDSVASGSKKANWTECECERQPPFFLVPADLASFMLEFQFGLNFKNPKQLRADDFHLPQISVFLQ